MEAFDLDDYFNLGNILKRRRIITDRQLKKALKFQHKTQAPLGEILVELGFCTAMDVVHALRTQEKQRIEPETKSDAAFDRLEAAVDSLEESAADLSKLSKRGVMVVDVSSDDSGAIPMAPPADVGAN